MKEVFYQKFRPHDICHLLGQEVVKRMIKNTCKKEFFHHSYLLAGKFGTGKTSVARILASLITCENRAHGSTKVCGKCQACKAVYGGGSVDIQEWNAATDSKVENMRGVVESSHYAPQSMKAKIFIIDECHCLSTAAMSSLLKTLEEPPANSYFILCTTEFDKVPEPIQSRCQNLFFHPISSSKLSPFLSALFNSLKVEIDKKAIDLILASSKGSVRDALEIAQELVVMCDKGITENDVSMLLGTAGQSDLYSLIENMLEGDLLSAFDIIESILISNVNIRAVAGQIAENFRNLMLATISEKYISNLMDSEKVFVKKNASKTTPGKLSEILGVFEEAERGFQVNINNRWVIETIVVKTIKILN